MVVVARSVTIFKSGQSVAEHCDGSKNPALSARIGWSRIRRYEFFTSSSLRRRLGQYRTGKAGVKRGGVYERLKNRASRAVLHRVIKLASPVVPSSNQRQNLARMRVECHQCDLGIINRRVVARFHPLCMQLLYLLVDDLHALRN